VLFKSLSQDPCKKPLTGIFERDLNYRHSSPVISHEQNKSIFVLSWFPRPSFKVGEVSPAERRAE